MLIRAGFDIAVTTPVNVPVLLALAPYPELIEPVIGTSQIHSAPALPIETFRDAFGNRIARATLPPGETQLLCDFVVRHSGDADPVHPELGQSDVAELPSDVLPFLMPSRYVESDLLSQEAWNRFGHTPPGWQRVQAVCDFVHGHIRFGYGYGRSTKTALDAFTEGAGVCRDFAHLSIAFCRALNIPARYASGYLGDIGIPFNPDPMDFCAWFEVWLDGRWWTFDARYNVPRIGRILMVRGRDAADVAMVTSFGPHALSRFVVWCEEIPENRSRAEITESLRTPADTAEITILRRA